MEAELNVRFGFSASCPMVILPEPVQLALSASTVNVYAKGVVVGIVTATVFVAGVVFGIMLFVVGGTVKGAVKV